MRFLEKFSFMSIVKSIHPCSIATC